VQSLGFVLLFFEVCFMSCFFDFFEDVALPSEKLVFANSELYKKDH